MITLGGIELDDSFIWEERYYAAPVAQTARRTLGGLLVLTGAQLIAGRLITLGGSNEQGWLSRGTAESILALAEDPLGVHTLVFGSETFEVAFRHYEPPAVELSPFVPRTEDEPEDWCTGTIKLITV